MKTSGIDHYNARGSSFVSQQGACDGRLQGDLLDRTFAFAVLVLELVDDLPNSNKG
jgi:hypothetical protein